MCTQNNLPYLDIIKNVSSNSVSSLVSSSGKGRTTDLAVLTAKLVHDQGGRQVMVVKPNDLATMTNYNDAKNKQDKGSVGYSVGEAKSYSETTPLVYITTSSLNSFILSLLHQYIEDNDTNLHWCDVLMVDEAYSGTVDTELLLYLWNECYNTGKEVPRLLLLSSTSNLCPYLPPYPTINTNDVLAPIKYVSNDNSNKTCDRIVNVLTSFHNNNPLSPSRTDTWIVFLPSESDLFRVFQGIQDLDVDIVKIWSLDMTNPDTRRIRNALVNGKRRIILSTNVGEDIGLVGSIVFDSMTTTANINSMTRVMNISKKKAHHRGSCATELIVRLTSEEKYKTQHMEGNPSEIKNTNLTSLALFILSNGMSYEDFYTTTGVNSDMIKNTNRELVNLNVVDFTGSDGFRVTDSGMFVFNTNMPIKEGVVLHKWLKTNDSPTDVYTAVALTSLLSTSIIKVLNDASQKMLVTGYEYNDVATNLSLFLYIISTIGVDKLKSKRKDTLTLCKALNVNYKMFSAVATTVESRLQYLMDHHPTVAKRQGSSDNLAVTLKEFDVYVSSVYMFEKLSMIPEKVKTYVKDNVVYRWFPLNRAFIDKEEMPPSLILLQEGVMKDKTNRVFFVANYSYVVRPNKVSMKSVGEHRKMKSKMSSKLSKKASVDNHVGTTDNIDMNFDFDI